MSYLFVWLSHQVTESNDRCPIFVDKTQTQETTSMHLAFGSLWALTYHIIPI